jgi:U3 small nucleolar RNA-associated protein 25
VDEQIDSFKDSERPSEKPAEEEIYLNEDSSSDDGVQEQPSVKPYYALLRSLNPKSDRGQPHRKKQKTQLDDRNLEPQTRENSRLELEDELDPVDETQELEKSSQDEVLEVDEADENLEENADGTSEHIRLIYISEANMSRS